MLTAMPSAPTTERERKVGRPRDARFDQAILEAGAGLIGAHGIGGFSVDAVAEAAGCSKATIYRRWSTKEALLLDVWRGLASSAETPDTGSLRDDLLAYVGGLASAIHSGPLAKVLPQMMAVAMVDEAFATEYRAFRRERRRPFREIVAHGVARGELPADTDPDSLHDLLIGPVYSRTIFDGRPFSPAAVERLVDIILAGVAAVHAPSE